MDTAITAPITYKNRLRLLKAAKKRIDDALHFVVNLRHPLSTITWMEDAPLRRNNDNDLLRQVESALNLGQIEGLMALREAIKGRMHSLYTSTH